VWRRAAVRGRRRPIEKFVLYQELDGRGARRGVEVVVVGGGGSGGGCRVPRVESLGIGLGHFEQRPREDPRQVGGGGAGGHVGHLLRERLLPPGSLGGGDTGIGHFSHCAHHHQFHQQLIGLGGRGGGIGGGMSPER